jgi:hypothetical protein
MVIIKETLLTPPCKAPPSDAHKPNISQQAKKKCSSNLCSFEWLFSQMKCDTTNYNNSAIIKVGNSKSVNQSTLDLLTTNALVRPANIIVILTMENNNQFI